MVPRVAPWRPTTVTYVSQMQHQMVVIIQMVHMGTCALYMNITYRGEGGGGVELSKVASILCGCIILFEVVGETQEDGLQPFQVVLYGSILQQPCLHLISCIGSICMGRNSICY